jgi:hypothetical protein
MMHVQQPLRQRNRYQPRPPKAVLYCRLEGIGTAELGVYDDESNGPVYNDCKADEEDSACDEAGVAEGVGLADDAGASAVC